MRLSPGIELWSPVWEAALSTTQPTWPDYKASHLHLPFPGPIKITDNLWARSIISAEQPIRTYRLYYIRLENLWIRFEHGSIQKRYRQKKTEPKAWQRSTNNPKDTSGVNSDKASSIIIYCHEPCDRAFIGSRKERTVWTLEPSWETTLLPTTLYYSISRKTAYLDWERYRLAYNYMPALLAVLSGGQIASPTRIGIVYRYSNRAHAPPLHGQVRYK